MSQGAKKKVFLKIIILGESGVGKTALLNKYINGKFIEEHKATIGADFLTKEITVDNKLITLQIWDTAGQERFQSLGSAFYRGADACVLVYDVLSEQTFAKIEEWRSNFIAQAQPDDPKKFPFLLLGNKLDKCSLNNNQRQVEKQKAENYAKNHQMTFFETSALEGTNIETAMKTISGTAAEMDSAPYFSPEIDENEINLEDFVEKETPASSSCSC